MSPSLHSTVHLPFKELIVQPITAFRQFRKEAPWPATLVLYVGVSLIQVMATLFSSKGSNPAFVMLTRLWPALGDPRIYAFSLLLAGLLFVTLMSILTHGAARLIHILLDGISFCVRFAGNHSSSYDLCQMDGLSS
jgi:hypothetical protein